MALDIGAITSSLKFVAYLEGVRELYRQGRAHVPAPPWKLAVEGGGRISTNFMAVSGAWCLKRWVIW